MRCYIIWHEVPVLYVRTSCALCDLHMTVAVHLKPCVHDLAEVCERMKSACLAGRFDLHRSFNCVYRICFPSFTHWLLVNGFHTSSGCTRYRGRTN
jgi:hypothetical protein